jgi:hypothetical protein
MEGGQMSEKRKALMVRFPQKLHQEMREVVAYLETDMTAFINQLVAQEVSNILKKRDNERGITE